MHSAAGKTEASTGSNSASEISHAPSPLECRRGRQIFGADFSIHYDADLQSVDLLPRVNATAPERTIQISAGEEDSLRSREASRLLAPYEDSQLQQYRHLLVPTGSSRHISISSIALFES